jgi:hypothetical protein
MNTVEIVFAAERLLVPAHGTLERIHRVAGAVLLAGLDIDAERDLAADAVTKLSSMWPSLPPTSANR